MLIRVFVLSFLVTAVTEGILAYLLGLKRREDQVLVLLANLLTNPAVIYLSLLSSLFLGREGRLTVLVLLEAAAVVAEALVYAFRLDWTKLPWGSVAGRLARGRPGNKSAALWLSLLLNLASYGAGELIEILIR